MKLRYSLEWSRANEPLAPIIAGLSLSPQDYVLAICGSGDQSFAILESGARVLAVDKNPVQAKYAFERSEKLRNGDLEGFLYHVRLPHDKKIVKVSDEYFLVEGRLERIRQNLDNLDFIRSDISDLPYEYKGFSRAYLSNAQFNRIESLKILRRLKKDSLIYTSQKAHFSLVKGQVLIKRSLTKKAQRLSKRNGLWKPEVLIKIS